MKIDEKLNKIEATS